MHRFSMARTCGLSLWRDTCGLQPKLDYASQLLETSCYAQARQCLAEPFRNRVCSVGVSKRGSCQRSAKKRSVAAESDIAAAAKADGDTLVGLLQRQQGSSVSADPTMRAFACGIAAKLTVRHVTVRLGKQVTPPRSGWAALRGTLRGLTVTGLVCGRSNSQNDVTGLQRERQDTFCPICWSLYTRTRRAPQKFDSQPHKTVEKMLHSKAQGIGPLLSTSHDISM